MRVTVHYLGQLRGAAACATEAVEMPAADASVARLFLHLADRHEPPLRRLLLDEAGQPQATLLIFLGDEQIGSDGLLHDGAEITLLTPIAGGSAAHA